MSIQEIIQSKIFCSLITGIFFVLIYKLYLYIKELRARYEYSDKLRDVVNNYIKKGKMTTAEFTGLYRVIREVGNYMGIYKDSFERLVETYEQHGDINYSDNIFDEKETSNETQKNDLETVVNENYKLKQKLIKKEKKDLIIHENEKDNPF